MDWDQATHGLPAALGIGLLIGAVRERQHGNAAALQAGVRTHALLALMGVVALSLGAAVFLVALLAAALLAWSSYRVTARDDPGLTGEIALLITVLLGGLALEARELAAALGISPRTVDHHRARILEKMNVKSVAELIALATR